MKLCCENCTPDCEFCIYLSMDVENACKLGMDVYCAAAESYPCEYFECFMFEKEERKNSRLEISKEEYIKAYEERD